MDSPPIRLKKPYDVLSKSVGTVSATIVAKSSDSSTDFVGKLWITLWIRYRKRLADAVFVELANYLPKLADNNRIHHISLIFNDINNNTTLSACLVSVFC